MDRLQLMNEFLSHWEDTPRDLAPATPDVARLFEGYHCNYIVADFYDSEPEVPPEWEDVPTCWDNPEFLTIWHELCAEYEPTRLKRLTWEELFQDGAWGMTQDYVDTQARELLERFCDTDRLYYAETENGLFFYCFARDLDEMCDYRIYLIPNS